MDTTVHPWPCLSDTTATRTAAPASTPSKEGPGVDESTAVETTDTTATTTTTAAAAAEL